MSFTFSNNGASTLAAGIDNVVTSLTVQSGQGARFPSPTGGDSFRCTLADASNNIEIVDVTARTGDVFTIVRGQEGTTPRSWLVSDSVTLRITAGVLDNFAQNEEAVLKAEAAVKSVGDLTFNDGVQLNFGTGVDVEMYYASGQLNMDLNGDEIFAIRDGNNGNANRFTFNAGTGELIMTGVLDVSGLFKMDGGYSEDADSIGVGPGTLNINADVASYFYTGPLVSPITFDFSTTVPANRVTSFTLEANGLGALGTLNWPASVDWPDGVEPIWSSGIDIITFFTRDGGTTWYGFAGGINMG